jgi:hypothetical protein
MQQDDEKPNGPRIVRPDLAGSNGKKQTPAAPPADTFIIYRPYDEPYAFEHLEWFGAGYCTADDKLNFTLSSPSYMQPVLAGCRQALRALHAGGRGVPCFQRIDQSHHLLIPSAGQTDQAQGTEGEPELPPGTVMIEVKAVVAFVAGTRIRLKRMANEKQNPFAWEEDEGKPHTYTGPFGSTHLLAGSGDLATRLLHCFEVTLENLMMRDSVLRAIVTARQMAGGQTVGLSPREAQLVEELMRRGGK